jgi:osmoprotectant transport system permease protein
VRVAHANWLVLFAAAVLVTGAAADPSPGPVSQSGQRPVIVASKVFTESVVLGEILSATLRKAGVPATHRRELGGTRVVWNALERGDVDAYVEYTGTLLKEVLAGDAGVDASADPQALADVLARRGIGIAARLGFNNTYVLGMRADKARSLNIRRLSDLREHRDLRYGLSNEFLSRADGWPGLQSAYDLTSAPSRGLQHELAYRAIEAWRR